MRPVGELCPPDQAHAFTCALTLAHFDAVLRNDTAAAAVLADGLQRTLAAHGIAADVESRR